MLNFFKKKSDGSNRDFFGEITDSMLKKAEETWEALDSMVDNTVEKINLKHNESEGHSEKVVADKEGNALANSVKDVSSAADAAQPNIKVYQLPWNAPDWSSVDVNTSIDPKEIYPLQLALRLFRKYGESDMRIGIFAVVAEEQPDDYEYFCRKLIHEGIVYIKYKSIISDLKDEPEMLKGYCPDNISAMTYSFTLREKLRDRYVFGGTEHNVIEAIINAMRISKGGKIFIEKLDRIGNNYYPTGDYLDLAEIMSEPIDAPWFARRLFDTYISYKIENANQENNVKANKRIASAKEDYNNKVLELEKRHEEELRILKVEHNAAIKASEAKLNEIESKYNFALKTIDDLRFAKSANQCNANLCNEDVDVRIAYTYTYKSYGYDSPHKSAITKTLHKDEYLALMNGGESAIKSYVQGFVRKYGETVISASMRRI